MSPERDPALPILFVSHEASRTGAPIILLNLLRWLRRETDLSFEILLREKGELEGDFRAIAPTKVFSATETIPPKLVERALSKKLGMPGVAESLRHRRVRRKLPSLDDYSLVYANGVASIPLLGYMSGVAPPLIAHMHELQTAIELLLKEPDLDRLRNAARVVACSSAVRDAFVSFGVPHDRIDIVHEFVDPPDSGSVPAPDRGVFGAPEDAFLIGGAGVREWRKGTDLFVHLARSTPDEIAGRPVRFVWVGASTNRMSDLQLRHEIRETAGGDRVIFIDPVEDLYPLLAGLDVFALTSREDPFPLVCLEAAALGKPVVCFDSGGIKEFVRDDAGIVVPYPDVAAMAAAIASLLEDEARRERLGEVGRARVDAHHRLEHLAPRLLEIIEAELPR